MRSEIWQTCLENPATGLFSAYLFVLGGKKKKNWAFLEERFGRCGRGSVASCTRSCEHSLRKVFLFVILDNLPRKFSFFPKLTKSNIFLWIPPHVSDEILSKNQVNTESEAVAQQQNTACRDRNEGWDDSGGFEPCCPSECIFFF